MVCGSPTCAAGAWRFLNHFQDTDVYDEAKVSCRTLSVPTPTFAVREVRLAPARVPEPVSEPLLAVLLSVSKPGEHEGVADQEAGGLLAASRPGHRRSTPRAHALPGLRTRCHGDRGLDSVAVN